eukprot:1125300-Prorocentrum_minimum.AAC.1
MNISNLDVLVLEVDPVLLLVHGERFVQLAHGVPLPSADGAPLPPAVVQIVRRVETAEERERRQQHVPARAAPVRAQHGHSKDPSRPLDGYGGSSHPLEHASESAARLGSGGARLVDRSTAALVTRVPLTCSDVNQLKNEKARVLKRVRMRSRSKNEETPTAALYAARCAATTTISPRRRCCSTAACAFRRFVQFQTTIDPRIEWIASC